MAQGSEVALNWRPHNSKYATFWGYFFAHSHFPLYNLPLFSPLFPSPAPLPLQIALIRSIGRLCLTSYSKRSVQKITNVRHYAHQVDSHQTRGWGYTQHVI